MESKKPVNQFQEVHKKVREVRDRIREIRERDSVIRQERAEKEAIREGFDRPIQGGKGRQDRDMMLSPVLLEELRAHWRRLRKRSSVWLFPGNRWHSGDQPMDTKTPRHACQQR